MSKTLRRRIRLTIAFTLALAGVVLATVSIGASYQGSADPRPSLPLEAWLVLSGALVTAGVNLEQLRRVRVDMKEVKAQNERDEDQHRKEIGKLNDQRNQEHEQNRETLNRLDRRLEHIEIEMAFINRREDRRQRRDDKDRT